MLELTWDYPTEGAHDDPDAEAVLREIGGVDLKTGEEVPDYLPLKDDGSTRVRVLDLRRLLRRRGQPGRAAQAGLASSRGWRRSGAGRGR